MISEIEFAYRYCNGTIIAITGSNGKTTTTMLTNDILQRAGLNVAMGGNLGNSFAALVADGDHSHYVLELSSFQLDGIIDFRSHIAVLLNITPDHLDRYAYRMQYYVESKSVSYTHLRAHETVLDIVCRLLLEKKNKNKT